MHMNAAVHRKTVPVDKLALLGACRWYEPIAMEWMQSRHERVGTMKMYSPVAALSGVDP